MIYELLHDQHYFRNSTNIIEIVLGIRFIDDIMSLSTIFCFEVKKL